MIIWNKNGLIFIEKAEVFVLEIENLEVGKGYKYKELCALLGEKETHNREKQKKKWNRYFVFEQRGQLYYILSVREEPLPDGRSKGNNSKYIHLFKDVIMYFLESQEDTVYKTRNEWLFAYNLVTSELFKQSSELADAYGSILNGHKMAYITNIQVDVVDFINRKFQSAIDNLKKTGHLTSFDTYMILLKNSPQRTATQAETKAINTLQNKVMAEFEVKSFLHAKWKKVFNRLINKINEQLQEKYGYKRVYRVLGLKRTKAEYEYTSENKESARTQLVELLYEGLKNHYINKEHNNKERTEKQKDIFFEHWLNDEDTSNDKISFVLEDGYANNMINILDIFLSL